MGQNLLRLLTNFWEGQRIVPCQQGYNGPAITSSRGQIQGGIFPPMGFNLLADKVIHYWLSITINHNGNTAISGLGWLFSMPTTC